jgi:hypothetical protein
MSHICLCIIHPTCVSYIPTSASSSFGISTTVASTTIAQVSLRGRLCISSRFCHLPYSGLLCRFDNHRASSPSGSPVYIIQASASSSFGIAVASITIAQVCLRGCLCVSPQLRVFLIRDCCRMYHPTPPCVPMLAVAPTHTASFSAFSALSVQVI